jgi:hypothetical protein
VLGGLPPRAVVLAEQLEHGRRVLSLETFLHVLRGDDRIVVLRDDASRHGAHLAERASAPSPENAQRENESAVTEQQLRA